MGFALRAEFVFELIAGGMMMKNTRTNIVTYFVWKF